MSEKIYAERDIIGMDSKGGHYCRHISAMTREGLHSKSDIAAELGFRDMVIAELEAKCAALAAEREIVNADNAYLRDQIMCLARECDRITYTHTNKVTDAHQSEAERDLANTYPASSALLAEVRASAVEEACLKISNAIVNCYQDEQIGLDAAATICGDFAAQLRQDANTAELVAAGIITKVGE